MHNVPGCWLFGDCVIIMGIPHAPVYQTYTGPGKLLSAHLHPVGNLSKLKSPP